MSETIEAPVLETEARPKAVHARFRALFVPMLAPLAALNDRSAWDWNPQFDGLQIEPAEEGGVYLVAGCKWAIGIVHDRRGRAEETIFIGLPEPLVAACREHKGPTLIDANGDTPLYSLPDWMLPGEVDVVDYPARGDDNGPLVMVHARGEMPPEIGEAFVDGGGLYAGVFAERLVMRSQAVPWRPLLAKYAEPEPVPGLRLQAAALGLLQPFGLVADLTFNGARGPVIVSAEGEDWTAKVVIMPIGERETEGAA